MYNHHVTVAGGDGSVESISSWWCLTLWVLWAVFLHRSQWVAQKGSNLTVNWLLPNCWYRKRGERNGQKPLQIISRDRSYGEGVFISLLKAGMSRNLKLERQWLSPAKLSNFFLQCWYHQTTPRFSGSQTEDFLNRSHMARHFHQNLRIEVFTSRSIR